MAVSVLRRDHLGQLVQARLRVVWLVGRADPDLVTGAGVAVVAEQLQDGAAGVAGVAAPAAALGFVSQREPVRSRTAQLDQRAGETFTRLTGDRGEPVAVDRAAFAVGAPLFAGLLPELGERHVVQRGEPPQIGHGDLTVGRPDRDR